jgi:hypothetical protein
MVEEWRGDVNRGRSGLSMFPVDVGGELGWVVEGTSRKRRSVQLKEL